MSAVVVAHGVVVVAHGVVVVAQGVVVVAHGVVVVAHGVVVVAQGVVVVAHGVVVSHGSPALATARYMVDARATNTARDTMKLCDMSVQGCSARRVRTGNWIA